jgi:hypothetical protein
MKAIPLILLAVLLFLYMNMEISSQSPCSSFSANPSLCTSDNHPG